MKKTPYFCNVKNRIALFLLLTYTFCNTPFKEVTRVPFLVIHYHQHLEENNDMSIWEYLDMHYMHGIIYDEDFFQDMQLPFKSVQDSQPIQVVLYSQVTHSSISCYDVYLYGHTAWHHVNWDIIQDPAVSGIFHPPRSLYSA